MKNISLRLSDSGVKALDHLKTRYPEMSQNECINHALMGWSMVQNCPPVNQFLVDIIAATDGNKEIDTNG